MGAVEPIDDPTVIRRFQVRCLARVPKKGGERALQLVEPEGFRGMLPYPFFHELGYELGYNGRGLLGHRWSPWRDGSYLRRSGLKNS